jgi:hypothetical protein
MVFDIVNHNIENIDNYDIRVVYDNGEIQSYNITFFILLK